MENKTDAKVYSYHTFYFPFVWDDVGNLSIDDIIAGFEKHDKWKDISVDTFEDASDDKIVNYQSLQFFTSAARKSLFGWQEKFVKCFEYSGIKNDAVYYIYKETFDSKAATTIFTEYKLNLDGIKLKLYNTGIAILTFEAENKDYPAMEDVKNINEYGRRIFAPYFYENVCSLCATLLGIKFKDRDVLCPVSQFMPKNEEQCIPDFITCLLPDIKIIPAIDDRMFVACLVNDAEEYKKHIDYKIDDESSKITDIHLNYETNPEASKNLYEFFYIDKNGDCSCPSDNMRNRLLSQSIYDRWAEYIYDNNIEGTIYGVTHHSFMCLTSASLEDVISRPFLTIYTHMISVILAQRASIIAFDNKISNSSRGFENNKSKISLSHIKKLKKLQDSYIAFLNQHMNIEVTCQEQGLELYNLLQREMYVCQEQELLSKEISLLNDAADIANEIRNNRLAFLLTILFGVISALPLFNILTWLWEMICKLCNML